MKQIVLASLLAVVAQSAFADHYVSGHTRKDGTYVEGHMASDPDQYRYNNRSSQSMGGNQRDEFSSGMGATNKRNSGYGYRDNDNDGLSNNYDPKPESKCNYAYGC